MGYEKLKERYEDLMSMVIRNLWILQSLTRKWARISQQQDRDARTREWTTK